MVCRSTPSFTEEERAHLLLLGATAGCPSVVTRAVQSGDIFDPEHMRQALALQAEWAYGTEILRRFLAEQRASRE